MSGPVKNRVGTNVPGNECPGFYIYSLGKIIIWSPGGTVCPPVQIDGVLFVLMCKNDGVLFVRGTICL